MLIGYVSDERYVALDDVGIEFERDGATVAVVRSTPRGKVIADIPPGRYEVTLRKQGFGRKRVTVSVAADGRPYQFRLLSDRLTGFVWPRWVRAGERAELMFHALEPYRLSLWRYGREREFVRILGWWDEHGPDANQQITPDGDYTQTGVRFNKVGYGNPHHTQLVTAPARGGLYYVEMDGESGAFFAAPWVVAPAAGATPGGPIAVVMSTNTWNAYNNFGGRSNYVNSTGLPPEPTVYGRQELTRYKPQSAADWASPDEAFLPLTFERPEPFNSVPKGARPEDSIAGRQPNHLAPAEWRLLAWLEREGFAFDVFSDAQLDDGTLDLDAYRVVMISAHPEYWTRRAYERTLAWVEERGGHFMYLGGNGLNAEIELLDGATRMHVNSHLAAVQGSLGQPDPANPEHWFDSRFHRATGLPEARLLGVATTETGIMTAAPYRALKAGHWAFAGTGLGDGDIFGTESQHERVSGGASGHETDKMSKESPAGTVLLAKGLNPDDGGAEIVVFETPSGGGTFSVGSIVWPASLLVDDAISRITRNVLERFGGRD
jgi:N,N-dimethylformamidase